MTAPDDILRRSQDICDFFECAEILAGIKCLMLFVRDFSGEHRHVDEAIEMSAEAHLLETERRQSKMPSRTWRDSVKKLIRQALQLMRAIMRGSMGGAAHG